MLFLTGVDHGYCKKAKRTRRYLPRYRRVLKKGRLYHTLLNPIFSKGKRRLEIFHFKTAVLRRNTLADNNGLVVWCQRTSAQKLSKKEPIIRAPAGYGLSALRLCVWLFDN